MNVVLDYRVITDAISNHQFRVLENSGEYTLTHLNKAQELLVLSCVEQACRSEMVQKHGAVAVRYGSVVAQGYNYDFGQEIMHGHYSVHAEVNVILECKKQKIDLSEVDIYVIRLKTQKIRPRRGKPYTKVLGIQNSAPCENCARMKDRYGARRIFYS